MKSIKYLIWSLALAAGVFTACTKGDTYEPAEKESGAGVGFSSEANTAFSILDNTFVEVPVLRDDASSALTVSVTASSSSSVFSIPSSVSFAAGETTANLTVSLDLDKFEYDSTHSVELKLEAGANATVYKPQTLVVTISRPAPWVSLGMATYTDDFMTTFFNVDNLTYEVEIQENAITPGYYRLVNPYGEAYPYNEPGDWDESQDYYFEIHAEDPTAVWIGVQNMGFDWGYGEFYMGSIAGLYIGNGSMDVAQAKAQGYTGTLENGVITFPASVLLIAMADYNDAGLYTANGKSLFRVVLPGYDVVEYDYSVDIYLTGFFTDLNDENYAVVGVSMGDDVEKVLLASAEGKDDEALLYAMLNGEVECVEVTASGQAYVPAIDGRNVVVAISYADGEPQEASSLVYTKSFGGGSGEVPFYPLEEEWTTADIEPMYTSELFKTWIMYAVDLYGDSADRVPMNYVTISDAEDFEIEGELIDAINVTGLTLGMFENDATQWEYYMGYVYTLAHDGWWGQVGATDGNTYNVGTWLYSLNGYYLDMDYAMIGGLVHEGHVAIVDADTGVDMCGYRFLLFDDAGSQVGTVGGLWYQDMMLVDPQVADLAAPKSNHRSSMFELKTLANDVKTPQNYVEKRGRARVRALIDELVAKKAAEKVEACDVEVKSSAKIRRSHGKELQPAAATLRIQ